MIIHQGSAVNISTILSCSRIVCLVPSITWLLYDLGLNKNIIGVSKFCMIPSGVSSNAVLIGGTKDPRIQKIISLKPDLIIANKEENRKEDIQILSENHLVYVSDVIHLESMYVMIRDIAKLTSTELKAELIISKIESRHNEFVSQNSRFDRMNILYLIWKDPYMTIGNDTFIHYMMGLAGYQNVYAEMTRYPEIVLEDILDKNPDYLFLSSEPYPFKEKHILEFHPLKSVMVDGKIFSWYGSYIIRSFDYLNILSKKINSSL